MHKTTNGAPAANKQNTDAPSFDKDYRCRSMLFLTSWSRSDAFGICVARREQFVFHSGGRHIVFEFATALRCFAKR
jgi:hypothetical protein